MITIETLHNSIEFKDLTYHKKGPTANVNLNNFIDKATLYDEIKLAESEKYQMDFKSELSDIE